MIEMQPLERLSLRDQAYTSIRAWIVDGKLSPGSKLVEQTLADMLGVSRMPVKEALLRLEWDGFVSTTSEGRFVRRFSEKDLQRIYTVRRGLESMAARLAAERMTPAEAALLTERLEAFRAAWAATDADAFSETDIAIHHTIWRLADNPFLLNALDSIASLTFVLIKSYTRSTGHNWNFTLAEHEEVVQTVIAGDPAQAANVMSAHIERSYARGLAVLAPGAQAAPL